MESLIELLLTLVGKVPFLSEAERDKATDLVRRFASSVGQDDAVPPPPSDQPTPAPPTPVVDPGPVAEPVPADQQTPPPPSPEVVAVGDAEQSNAFAQAAEDVPGSP